MIKRFFLLTPIVLLCGCSNVLYENVEYTSGQFFYVVSVEEETYKVKVENVYNFYLNSYRYTNDGKNILYNDLSTNPLRLCIYNY